MCVQKQLKLKQLRLCRSVQDDGRCGLGIVNSRIVEFSAYGIPAHELCIVRLENVTNCLEVGHVWIKPEVVLVRCHNHSDIYTTGGSFPSGHATVIWAFSHVVADETPGHRWLHVGLYAIAAGCVSPV